jgi:hypothetical protein
MGKSKSAIFRRFKREFPYETGVSGKALKLSVEEQIKIIQSYPKHFVIRGGKKTLQTIAFDAQVIKNSLELTEKTQRPIALNAVDLDDSLLSMIINKIVENTNNSNKQIVELARIVSNSGLLNNPPEKDINDSDIDKSDLIKTASVLYQERGPL